MTENKKKFSVTVDGKELHLAVVRPNAKQKAQGQLVYAKAFKEAATAGAILRAKVKGLMRDQGLWDEARQKEVDRINARVKENTLALKRGKRANGKRLKLSEGRDIAVQVRRDRAELRRLDADRSTIDQTTAEGLADNKQFNYFVSVCTLYNDGPLQGRPYYKDLEDYEERPDDPVGPQAASHLIGLLYGIDSNFEATLPENEFLLKHDLCRPGDLHLLKDGQLVDGDGRRVDEEGFFLDDQGRRIDRDGNLLGKDGDYLLEDAVPFLDEEGRELVGKKEKENPSPALA